MSIHVKLEPGAEFVAAFFDMIKPPFVSKFGATWFHEVGRNKPNRNWLVKNLVLARTFGIVYGPPGCGKSFLITDLCLTVAVAALMGKDMIGDWFGYRGRPVGVIYVVAEGRDDFEVRLHAWRLEYRIPDEAVIPFVFLPTSIDMRSDDADTKWLAEEVKAISDEMVKRCGVPAELIVIDTVARVLAGGNENASEVMSGFVRNCGLLQEAVKTAVLGVHHGGKEAGRGPRGHEALHGAADFEIEVASASDQSPNMWTVRKLKAGPAGASHRFRLKPLTVGYDADADPITSCVVLNKTSSEEPDPRDEKRKFLPDLERDFMRVLGDAIERHGVMPTPDIPCGANVHLVVNNEHVRSLFWEQYKMTESGDTKAVEDRLRQRWKRASGRLITKRFVEAKHPWVWMSGKRTAGVTLKGATELGDEAVTAAENHVTGAAEPVTDDGLPF